jgi:hypothetical protein
MPQLTAGDLRDSRRGTRVLIKHVADRKVSRDIFLACGYSQDVQATGPEIAHKQLLVCNGYGSGSIAQTDWKSLKSACHLWHAGTLSHPSSTDLLSMCFGQSGWWM